jgi:long-subunit fatty acid transport protein
MDKLAISIGFNPIGGGGGAIYEQGLPSFEMSPSDLVPSLAASQGATAYRLNAYFKGTSIFFGLQGALSYKINDWLSVAAGLRYVIAKNTYSGHLTDIEVQLPGGWTRGDLIMTNAATSYNTAAAGSSALVAGGAGTLTFAQAQGAGIITTTQRAQFEGALTAAGYPAATPIAQADAIYKGSAAKYAATATLLADQTAKVEQNGTGTTGFFSVNLSPSENVNIGIKYEMATKLNLKNKTTSDILVGYTATGTPITMFPNGEKTRNDMPAMLTVGIDYKLSSSLKLSAGSSYFFDKSADYGHMIDADLVETTPTTHVSNKDIIANNGLDLEVGLEYNISKQILISGGYLWANKGVNNLYQSDLTYANASHTFGAGGAYSFTDKIKLNIGVGYTMYVENQKVVDHIFSATDTNIPSNETYGKDTFMVAAGLDIRF